MSLSCQSQCWSGHMTVTLTKGAMRMVGGNVSHTQGATIKTPLAHARRARSVATVTHDKRGTRAINHFGTVTVSSGGATETITSTRVWCVGKSSGGRPSAPAPVPQTRSPR